MEKEIKEILLRYTVGIVVAILALLIPLFYFIFRPLTVFPTVFILKIFYDVNFSLSSINIDNFNIEIIDACIAGSAYSLLFILNILTAGLSLKRRFFVFVFDAILLLLMNIIRLVIMIVLLVNNFFAFDITHKIFWYVISTAYVAFIWILTVFIFNIKTIPFVSDLKVILKNLD